MNHHFQLGVALGSLSVGEDFDGLLPWGLVEHRPFLCCLHGLSRALLCCGRREDADAALRRLLRLDPDHPLGARERLMVRYFDAHLDFAGDASTGGSARARTI